MLVAAAASDNEDEDVREEEEEEDDDDEEKVDESVFGDNVVFKADASLLLLENVVRVSARGCCCCFCLVQSSKAGCPRSSTKITAASAVSADAEDDAPEKKLEDDTSLVFTSIMGRKEIKAKSDKRLLSKMSEWFF